MLKPPIGTSICETWIRLEIGSLIPRIHCQQLKLPATTRTKLKLSLEPHYGQMTAIGSHYGCHTGVWGAIGQGIMGAVYV